MIFAIIAFGVLVMMWVVLPSRLHRGNKPEEE